MPSRSRRIKDIHKQSSLSPNNSKSRKRKFDTFETTSLSLNNSKIKKRKLNTPPKTTSLSPNEIKTLEYINESFKFLRDTSILKTKHVRNEDDTAHANEIKDTNKKLLLKYPELNNNVKFAAMIKGTNTRTFGGKVKKTYKNNNTKKRRTVKRKSM